MAPGPASTPDRPRADGGRELTLIATEMLDEVFAASGIRLEPVESRRNLLTSGIGLNELIGATFTIDEVVCEGIDYCTPCEHLVELTGKDVLRPLVNRGGCARGLWRAGRSGSARPCARSMGRPWRPPRPPPPQPVPESSSIERGAIG